MFEFDTGLLYVFLAHLCGPLGTGAVASWVQKQLIPAWPVLKRQPPIVQFVLSMVAASSVSLLAYGAAAWLGFVAVPSVTRDWVTTLFSVAAVAWVGNQAVYRIPKLVNGE